jgi:hypothetical protein
MGKACSTIGEKRNAYKKLVGKPYEKRLGCLGGWTMLKLISEA